MLVLARSSATGPEALRVGYFLIFHHTPYTYLAILPFFERVTVPNTDDLFDEKT